MTVYIGKPLAITEMQTNAINSMFSTHIGKLPVEVSMLLFGAYNSLGAKAAAGKIEVARHADGRVEALLMKEHQFDHRPLFDALRMDGAPQDDPSDLNAEVDALFTPRAAAQPIESRIAELMHIIEDNRDAAYGDDLSEESIAALTRITEAEKELFDLPLRTVEDVYDVLRLIRREFLKDMVGEELGWGQVGVLNFLDGIAKYVRQQAR